MELAVRLIRAVRSTRLQIQRGELKGGYGFDIGNPGRLVAGSYGVDDGG